MLKTMRLKVNCDERGAITSGEMGKNNLPKKLGYFNVAVYPELIEAYSDKPQSLTLMFPSDRIEDFYDINFTRWGKNKKGEGVLIRKCDEEECVHRTSDTIGDQTFAAGEITPCICRELDEKSEDRCKCFCWLKAWVVNPATGMIDNHLCYLFQTGSRNSGENIYSELKMISDLNHGHIRGVRFKLSVEMVGKKDDAKMTFPIWKLHAVQTLLELRTGPVAQLPGKTEPAQLPPAKPSNDHEDKLNALISDIRDAASQEEMDGLRITSLAFISSLSEPEKARLRVEWLSRQKTLKEESNQAAPII
jgi:hypothetical protein